MYHLIYVSQAKAPMASAALEDILKVSHRNNTRDGLTGMLIYRYAPDRKQGHFIQMLEGEQTAVEATYARIAADERHHTKIILDRGDTPKRYFPNWTMGFKNADASDLSAVTGFTYLGDETFQDRVDSGELAGALDLLRSFYSDDE